MAGLKLGVNGVVTGGQPIYGNVRQPATASEAAFGMGATAQAPSMGTILHPGNGFGLAFWSGVTAIGLLVIIRKSLPN